MQFLHRHTHDRGAGRALAGLYREHSGAAYTFAFHLTGSREDAEDLVQVAFLLAHRALSSGDELMNPRAWLATVIRRRAANLYRDRREDAASDRIETLVGEHEGADDARAELDRIRVVLHSLPEAQHHAFVLRYWSDLSYREIASVLDTTESAVEALLVRARAAVVANPDISGECSDIHRRLSADAPLSRVQERHLGSCRRCEAARTSLARAAGIAAAAALLPRVHVAQALAAAAPGFTVAGATGAGTAGGASAVFGKTAAGLKAALLAGAVAGSVAGVHAGLDRGQPQHRLASAAGRAAAARHASPASGSGDAPMSGQNAAGTSAGAHAAVAVNGHERRSAPTYEDRSGGVSDGGSSDGGGDAQSTGGDQGGDTQSTGDQGGDTQSGSGDTGSASGNGAGEEASGGGSSNDGGSSGGADQSGSD